MSHARFGTCCKDLEDALGAPNSFFRTEDNGVLSLTVGYTENADGHGYFDQAVLYCPFCGKQLQDVDDIAKTQKR